jgi:hypothetical protein
MSGLFMSCITTSWEPASRFTVSIVSLQTEQPALNTSILFLFAIASSFTPPQTHSGFQIQSVVIGALARLARYGALCCNASGQRVPERSHNQQQNRTVQHRTGFPTKLADHYPSRGD